MKVGYVRCSTAEQNEARQLKMMEEQGVEKIFLDKASGKNIDRTDFKAMMNFVRSGDTVIVESIVIERMDPLEASVEIQNGIEINRLLFICLDQLFQFVVDLFCRTEMIGTKVPRSVKVFTVVFEIDNKKRIKLDVPEEMYDGIETGQSGEVTVVEGELYSFVI